MVVNGNGNDECEGDDDNVDCAAVVGVLVPLWFSLSLSSPSL